MKHYTHFTPEQNRELLSLVDLKKGGARKAAIAALATKWKREPASVASAVVRLKKLRDTGKLNGLVAAPLLPFPMAKDETQESVLEVKIKRFEIVGDRLKVFF